MARNRDDNFMERLMKQVIKGLITLIILVVLIALVVIPIVKERFGGILGKVEESDIKVTEEVIESEDLQLAGYSVSIAAMAENTAKKDVERVVLTYDLLDSEGNVVGNAMATIEGITSGEKKEFRAVSVSPLAEVPASYELKSIIIT